MLRAGGKLGFTDSRREELGVTKKGEAGLLVPFSRDSDYMAANRRVLTVTFDLESLLPLH